MFSLRERIRRRRLSRHGTIYIVTLTTTMIVTALGTAALATARIHRQRAADGSSWRQAQLHAASALQIARYQMLNDPLWRSKLKNHTWGTARAIGTGSYSFTGTDPVDGDLTDGNFDPVVITATGIQGDARHSMSAVFEVQQPGLSCLNHALHADNDLELVNVTATSPNGTLGSNKRIVVDSAAVTANCSANSGVTSTNGGTIVGTIVNTAPLLALPQDSSLLSYYEGLGTAILATSLPMWDRDLVTNPGAETGAVAPWEPRNCSATISSSQRRTGNFSFYISSRSLLADGTIVQDVTAQVSQNVPYLVSAHVLDPNLLGLDSYRLHLRVRTTTGDTSYTSSWKGASYNTWTALSFSPTLTWTGDLLKAELFIQTSLGLGNYYIDDLTIREAGAESLTYVIHRELLSPQNNPFTGALNAQGIYVLNCNGMKINIRDSRILGTLVILNAAIDSRIEGSVCWEPTVWQSTDPDQPNLPALLTNSKLIIGLNNSPVSEASINRNLNPTGSPYAGSTDTDRTDSFPSQIASIVYSSHHLTLTRYTTIRGCVLGAAKVAIRDPSPAGSLVTVRHLPLYRYVNPPIGFRAAPVVTMVRSSVEQVVQ